MRWSRDRQIGRLQTHIETVDSFTMVGSRVLILEACWFGFTLSWAFSHSQSWALCIKYKVSIHMFFLNALVFTTYDTILMPFSHLLQIWSFSVQNQIKISENSQESWLVPSYQWRYLHYFTTIYLFFLVNPTLFAASLSISPAEALA